MKQVAVLFLCAVLFCLPAAAGASTQIDCPSGGFSFTVPDSFTVMDISDGEDPDLCLWLESSKMSISVYVSFVGNVSPDTLPFILTGDETDMGSRKISGRKVQYITGSADGQSYYSCFWMVQKDGVTLDFRFSGKLSKVKKTIDSILGTVEWTD